MPYAVVKRIEFCYGHRLLEYDGKCKHLHGHNGVLELTVEAPALDRLGMVVDFGVIRDVVKSWVDDQLDHRMILSSADPFVPVLQQLGEPLFLMDDNPTAENLARLVLGEARRRGLNVVEVRLWETPQACAVYRSG